MTGPKKPPRFPSHLNFPREGPVERVVEPLPQSQPELELAIGHKFLGALAHFHDVQLSALRRGEEPADLLCTSESGEDVSIQVVEALDHLLRQATEMRAEYLAALTERQGEFASAFSGCSLSIVDVGDPPYLPKVRTKAGQECLEELCTGLGVVATSIVGLPVGLQRREDVLVGPNKRSLAVLVTRHEAASSPDRFSMSWRGAGPAFRADLSRDILPSAIRAKVAKRYARPRSRFLLLAYSIDTFFAPDAPDISESARLLEHCDNPFDEAWYIYPYAEAPLGHVVRIWRRSAPTAG